MHAVISTVSLCVLYILRVSCSSLVRVEMSGPRVIVSSFNMSRVLSVVYECTQGSVCMVRVNIIHTGSAVVVVVGISL